MLADTGKTAYQHMSAPIPVCQTTYLYWKGGKATSPQEESEKGNPAPEGNRTPRTDALHQKDLLVSELAKGANLRECIEVKTLKISLPSTRWSLRMGLVMREVRCKSFGRRNQKIKMYEPVYIPSPVIRHHKMPSRKKQFPSRGTRKDCGRLLKLKLKLNSRRRRG